MKHDYTGLDAAILAAIRKGQPQLFTGLIAGDVKRHADALEADVRGKGRGPRDDKPGWRFVDARLQALRRQGLISYQREPEGWVIAEASC